MESARSRHLQIAAARAEFLAEGAGIDDVRAVVAASWERSRTAGVDALGAGASFHSDLDVDGRLVFAARGVVDRLADEASELALSIALTDARSRLLLRVDTEQRIGRLLDSVCFAPGFDYGESSVGTNGVGTAFESGQAITIHGPEHFSERLQPFSCTGAPIRDPLTGRVEGILDITCLFEDSTPILRSLVRSATADIERALLLDRGHDQQAVFDTYVRLTGRSRGAVGAMGRSTLLTSQELQEGFTAGEREELRAHARFLAERHERIDEEVELSSGRVRIEAFRVTSRTRPAGVAFTVSRVQEPKATREHTSAPATARTPGWRRTQSEVLAALAASSPIVLAGERSTGRVVLLRECFGALHPDGQVVEVASADEALALARRLPDEPSPTLALIRRLDEWEGAHAAAVVELAAEAIHPHAIAATFTGDGDSAGAAALLAPFVVCSLVPPLRHRGDDLPELAQSVLRRLGRPRSITPSALRALARHSWPGNIEELRAVLDAASSRRPTGSIEDSDLPPELYARTTRQLGGIEAAERDAIVAALHATDGNRLRAAERLGISRATLYRKLGQYRIEGTGGGAIRAG